MSLAEFTPHEQAMFKVAQLAGRHDGWDGHGAKRVTAPAIAAAIDHIDRLAEGMPAPGVWPSVGGGVILEWDDRDDSDVTFGPDGEAAP